MFDLNSKIIFNNNVKIYKGSPLYLEVDHYGTIKWTLIFKNEKHLKQVTGYELLDVNYSFFYILKYRYSQYKISDATDFDDEVFDFRKVTKKLNMENLTEKEEEERDDSFSDNEMEDYFDNEDENV